jgi:lipopolysaccharide export system protein LptA
VRIRIGTSGLVVLALGLTAAAGLAAQAPPAGGPAERRVTTIKANRLESDRKRHVAIYTGEVEAADGEMTVWADRMELLWDDKEEQILKITAIGNVRIRRADGKNAASERAEFYKAEERLVLVGKARAWQGDDSVSGARMTMHLREDRTVVEGDGVERVRTVFTPKRGAGAEAGEASPTRRGADRPLR